MSFLLDHVIIMHDFLLLLSTWFICNIRILINRLIKLLGSALLMLRILRDLLLQRSDYCVILSSLNLLGKLEFLVLILGILLFFCMFIKAFCIVYMTVKHVGGAMRGAGAKQISVLVRSMVESKTSKNVLRLLYALGYKLDHELLRVGFTFHFQRGAQITVTVSSVNKMLKLHATDEAVPVTPGRSDCPCDI